MIHRFLGGTAKIAGLLAIAPLSACAQSLAARIENAPVGHVHFSFPARAGICGNAAAGWIRTGPGSYTGTLRISDDRTETCESGPVRVLVDRAGREIIAVTTYVGNDPALPPHTDLGEVRAQDATRFLLRLAATTAGRIGRDAIFPATLAADADIAGDLAGIAQNQDLPRETRTTAISHIARATGPAATSPDVISTIVKISRDDSDNVNVRKQALTALSRLQHGAGIPALIELAGQNANAWLAREAMNVVAASGDPRARAFLRSAVQRQDVSDEALAIAVRGLGQNFATRQDAVILRDLYPRLRSDRARDAVLAAAADVGGDDNVNWLVARARDEAETPARRRRAIDHAIRAGAPTASLTRLYDDVAEQQLKEALIVALARNGDRTATDKLLSILRTETNVNARRRAISALGESADPRVRDALREIVIR